MKKISVSIIQNDYYTIDRSSRLRLWEDQRGHIGPGHVHPIFVFGDDAVSRVCSQRPNHSCQRRIWGLVSRYGRKPERDEMHEFGSLRRILA